MALHNSPGLIFNITSSTTCAFYISPLSSSADRTERLAIGRGSCFSCCWATQNVQRGHEHIGHGKAAGRQPRRVTLRRGAHTHTCTHTYTHHKHAANTGTRYIESEKYTESAVLAM
jgi:hypothetical protein